MDENKRKQIKTPYDPDSISMSKLEQVQQEMKLLDSIFEYGDENYKVLVEVEYKLRQRTELLHRMKREYDEFELNKEAWEQFVIQCGGRWESNPRPSRPRPNSDEPDKENHPHINPKKDQPEKRSQIEFAWHVNKNEHFTLLGQEELLYFANRIYWQNTIIEEYYDTSADIDIRINKKDIYSLFVQSILDCIAPYTFELNILLNKMINTIENIDDQIPVLEMDQNSLICLLSNINALEILRTYLDKKLNQKGHSIIADNPSNLALLLSNIDGLNMIKEIIIHRISTRKDLVNLFGKTDRSYLFSKQDGLKTSM